MFKANFNSSHQMYAVVEKIKTTFEDKILILDKSGRGQGHISGYKDIEETISIDDIKYIKDFAAVSVEDRVYVAGGFDIRDNAPTSAALMFDNTTNRWKVISRMRKRRSGHTMTQWADFLLVTGGCTTISGKLTPSCEIYCPKTDTWELFEVLLPDARCGHACVYHKGALYLSGGVNKLKKPQSNLWMLESRSDGWRNLDEHYPLYLPRPLAYHKMISLYDSIVLIAGLTLDDEDNMVASNQILSLKPTVSYLGNGSYKKDINETKYDRVTPWSSDFTHLTSGVYNFGLVQRGEKIVIFGGKSDDDTCNKVQIYEIKEDCTKCNEYELGSKTESLKLEECECMTIRYPRYSVVHELIPRNWPLW